MILWRTVSRDEDVQEDWGWKLVHREVFRAPRYPMVFSVMVGNGAQLCAMCAVTLVFALLGFLSLSNRGSLATVMMVKYASLGGVDKRKNTFLTATILPMLVFIVIFLLDFFLLIAGSPGAVPFSTTLLIVVL
ncbi:uncharacterized protein HD556DRAFT_1479430 [Suillus plorans]|uniref:Transmembrane 9 superfamily member n=1 Tax=Suillus plorans TaxID=116603 RepID=A0A9P7DGI7_9AGAM|nr:uncharacterized protein HD556DRAFT_1479430 [Suillus plorans]KAG1793329.1 hypothetical protein HD556DRAFT_1479430 [Suillus plorans]